MSRALSNVLWILADHGIARSKIEERHKRRLVVRDAVQLRLYSTLDQEVADSKERSAG